MSIQKKLGILALVLFLSLFTGAYSYFVIVGLLTLILLELIDIRKKM